MKHVKHLFASRQALFRLVRRSKQRIPCSQPGVAFTQHIQYIGYAMQQMSGLAGPFATFVCGFLRHACIPCHVRLEDFEGSQRLQGPAVSKLLKALAVTGVTKSTSGRSAAFLPADRGGRWPRCPFCQEPAKHLPRYPRGICRHAKPIQTLVKPGCYS